jgi:hypothetical protein
MMLERNIQTERGRETEDVLHDKKIQGADKWANVLHPVHDTPEETQVVERQLSVVSLHLSVWSSLCLNIDLEGVSNDGRM